MINTDGMSLSSVYNLSISYSPSPYMVFMHDDLIMETQGWGFRVLHHLQTGGYDIIGLAGVRKELPASGIWWEDPRNMVGIVNHLHIGKVYTSAYSNEQGLRVEPVISLDGLFIAANMGVVTHRWDETIPGFHFYDLGFCFPNYLAGHNIGVVTNIRVTHKSIGETNSQWEGNRRLFIEKYADELPCIQEFV